MDDRDQAFAAFVAARSGSLLRCAYLLTGEHAQAEDLLQATLIKVYLSWHRVRDHGAVEGYTRTVMTRTHISWWRRPARRESASANLPETAVGPVSSIDERDEMWRLLSTLGPRQRAVLVLRFYEDLTEAEIARVLECSVGTVKSQVSRGLARLREQASMPNDGGRSPLREESR